MNKGIFLVMALVLAAYPVCAGGVLERRVDVVFKETPIRDALQVIAQRAGFEWSYNAGILDATRKTNLIANDWTVRETLYEILGDGYEFKANGNYLILKKRRKQPEQLSGYVKDPATGQRLANATVYDRQTLRATTTDSNGYYELKVRKATEIVVARVDYRDTVFAVSRQTPRFQKIDLQVNTPSRKRPRTIEENLQTAATQAERFFKAALEKWNAVNVADSLHRRYQVSFLPVLGTNHTLSAKVVNDWSLNVLAGTSLGNRRLEVAGLANFTRKEIQGVQVAGVFNELHGNMYGVQIGGIYNRCGDTLSGVQVGGIFNHADCSNGTQVAGITNIAPTGMVLLQIGGIYNRCGDTLSGVQVGGIFNHADCSNGAQVAGITNIAPTGTVRLQVGGIHNHAQEVEGVQVAGIINRADTLTGIQVSTINRARKVKGLQIGLINSAKEVDGLQIGLINRSGRRVLPLINW
jgi:hypothetical protein